MTTGTQLQLFEGNSDEDIMELIGQASKRINYGPNQLRINRSPTTKEGAPLPVGVYSVYSPEHQEVIYAKTVKFRPFINTYQYRVYDAAEEKYENQTVLFKSFNEEIFDEKGGLSCGKISRKKWDQLTEKERANQERIRCSRILFGTVSLTGRAAPKKVGVDPETQEDMYDKGRPITVENVPVMWRTAGQSFMPVGEALDKLTEQNILMFTCQLELTTERQEKGSNTFYVVKATPPKEPQGLRLSDKDKEALKSFADYIVQTNNEIMDKWRKASTKKRSEPETVIDVLAELAPPPQVIDAELNDQLPL